MIKLEVGQKLNLAKSPERYLNYEGSIMEMHEGGELSIIIFLPGMSDKERNNLKKKKIKANVLQNQNMLVTYIRYQGTPLIFELPFNPGKYEDDRINKFNPKNLINVIGVDSKNMTIQTIRVVTAPYKLQDEWQESWKTDYSSYENWLNELQRINIVDLWDRGIYVGRMGEN